jgi:hypothetical protein
MTFVLLLCMLLFMGFCAVILAMGILDVFRNRKSEKPFGGATTQSDNEP